MRTKTSSSRTRMVLMFAGFLSRLGIVIQHTAFATTDRGIAVHEKVPVDFIESVWAGMARPRQHNFQILTNRTERMAEIATSLPLLRNVWMGTSIESAEYLWRLDVLRGTR